METQTETLEERVAQFGSALKDDGLRLTHQRLEIIRELARSEDHPDADTLFQRVRERVPTLSPDTVYRTVAALVERSLVERISMPRATRYDPDQSVHHHFMCDRCGRLEDVSPDVLSSLSAPGNLSGIGYVRSVHVELRGVCAGCGPDREAE